VPMNIEMGKSYTLHSRAIYVPAADSGPLPKCLLPFTVPSLPNYSPNISTPSCLMYHSFSNQIIFFLWCRVYASPPGHIVFSLVSNHVKSLCALYTVHIVGQSQEQ
jgi:hypothetical protein